MASVEEFTVDTEAYAIDNDIYRLRVLTNTNNESFEQYRKDIEMYLLSYSQITAQIQEAKNNQLIQPEAAVEYGVFIGNCEEEIRQNWQNLNQKRLNVHNSLRETIDLLTDVETRVISNRLSKWLHDQKLSGIGSAAVVGKNLNGMLDKIQSWFNELFNIMCSSQTLINNICNSNQQAGLGDELEAKAIEDITYVRQFIILSSFIIEKQPPPVIKKDSKFDVTVRLLLTSLHNNQCKSTVTASILSEAQAQIQWVQYMPLEESLCQILNCEGQLAFKAETSRYVTCRLDNMKMATTSRAGHRANGTVKNEKYALLLRTKLQFDNIDYFVWTISLPVAISVHNNQDSQTSGNITWDYAFSDIERTPYMVVDQVPWSKMAWLLQVKFESQTGCKLTDENLRFLFTKITNNTIGDPNTLTISWSSFCHNRQPGTKFTFWDWFYAVMRLINECLIKPWKEGLIIGFITKEETKNKLIDCPSGTFLLRFSDSVLGGISPAWVATVRNEQRVEFLKPFCQRDFTARRTSIADLIETIEECATLYPYTPKELAFRDHFTRATDVATPGTTTDTAPTRDYVGRGTRTVTIIQRPNSPSIENTDGTMNGPDTLRYLNQNEMQIDD